MIGGSEVVSGVAAAETRLFIISFSYAISAQINRIRYDLHSEHFATFLFPRKLIGKSFSYPLSQLNFFPNVFTNN